MYMHVCLYIRGKLRGKTKVNLVKKIFWFVLCCIKPNLKLCLKQEKNKNLKMG